MTNEEAIKILKDTAFLAYQNASLDEINEAVGMAVEALQRETSDDAIDRQAAIDATWKDPSYTDPLNVLTEVRDRIKALPSVQPEPHWIPVSEKLPDKIGSYLITQYNDDVTPYYYDGKWISGEYWRSYIKAWMPLPEPYREEGEQE